jgi:hypothetical protein
LGISCLKCRDRYPSDGREVPEVLRSILPVLKRWREKLVRDDVGETVVHATHSTQRSAVGSWQPRLSTSTLASSDDRMVELLLIDVHRKLVFSSCEERQCGGISAAVKTMITAGGTK